MVAQHFADGEEQTAILENRLWTEPITYMQRGSFISLSTISLLLEVLPLVIAHQESEHVETERPQITTVEAGPDHAVSYFAYSAYHGFIYGHIVLMLLAWAVVLPVGACDAF